VAKQSTAKKEIPSKQETSTTRAVKAGTAQKSAAPNLDRLIHERLRLGIISALAANASLTFSDLKNLMNTTDGNLSVHARKLEEAGYIACTKYFDGRLPKTEYKLTVEGRRALEGYINHMESLIKQMKST
jgi:DNA-binding HxlR family transcriptional regulator